MRFIHTALKRENRILAIPQFKALKPDQQQELRQVFEDKLNEASSQRLIAALRDLPRRFKDEDYLRLLEKIESWNRPPGGASSYPQPSYVPVRSVPVKFQKPWLANEADVERYLESMREALLREIHKGKRIQI